VNPSDFDDSDGGISFNELPPSVRQSYGRAPGPTASASYVNTAATSSTSYVNTAATPAPAGGRPVRPIPIEQYREVNPIRTVPGDSNQPPPPPPPEAPPSDKSGLMLIGATLVLGAIGWWAYSKMEKDKKIRVGPPRMRDDGAYGRDDFGDDAGDGYGRDYGDDDGGDADNEESAAPLDAYARVRKPKKMVDPHEEGGIKLVKG